MKVMQSGNRLLLLGADSEEHAKLMRIEAVKMISQGYDHLIIDVSELKSMNEPTFVAILWVKQLIEYSGGRMEVYGYQFHAIMRDAQTHKLFSSSNGKSKAE